MSKDLETWDGSVLDDDGNLPWERTSDYAGSSDYDDYDDHDEEDADMTKTERAELYRAYLSEEGFCPKIDSDGDVVFKFEGRIYYISVDTEDEYFFRLIFPNFWPIENEDERKRVNAATLQATAKTKVAKVFPVGDNVWAAIEMFCSPPEVFQAVFTRSIHALRAGVENFRKGMQE